MILQALVKHYETLAEKELAARPGWCRASVSYALDIDLEGNLLGIISLKEEFLRGKKTVWLPKSMEVPEMVPRAAGVSANFLCDNSKYMLGIDAKGTGRRILECFEASKEKHLHILEAVGTDAAIAVRNFFLKWNPETAKVHEDIADKWDDITASANLIFSFRMRFAQLDEAIREAWEADRRSTGSEAEGICLATGKKGGISRIHMPIKGVRGAQTMGTLLVSFNAPAFESYGKEQSYNAPVSEYSTFAYTTALNYLLAQREYVGTLGDATVVYWSEGGEEIYQWLLQLSTEPVVDNQEELKSLFDNLQEGKSIDVKGIRVDYNKQFYILGLAPNAARLSVRFFYHNSFGSILRNIRNHYDRMDIVRPAWDQQEYLGVGKMLFETVNQKSKDKNPQPNMATAVFKAILSGGRYPESLYQNVLIRIRAEQGNVTRGRAGMIKAHLIQNYGNPWLKEENFMALNERCTSISYILGREFAVLEAIQEEANPGLNATIKDRYFNSACAAPASVFPILLKLKNSHVRKFGREKEGKKIWYEQKLTDLQGRLDVDDGQILAYPKRLTLEEQGMFILGYYHEVQKRFEKKEEK